LTTFARLRKKLKISAYSLTEAPIVWVKGRSHEENSLSI